MFELPEYLTLARQINETLRGKNIREGRLGNSPHKFVWYNRTNEEFAELTRGKTIGDTRVKGRWMMTEFAPGYILVLGECGGKVLYHEAGANLPKKYHLWLTFEDDSFFTVTTQMWGAMELYEKGKELEREYIKDMRPTPVELAFTFDYFAGLINVLAEEKRSAKSLLTQDQLIPGLGNSIAQDILFKARLHPRHSIKELGSVQQQTLYDAIITTVQNVTARGGRHDETDLFGNLGDYVRLMDSKAAGNPCPACGTVIEKIQYLGGACYFCPNCQT